MRVCRLAAPRLPWYTAVTELMFYTCAADFLPLGSFHWLYRQS